MGSRVRIVVIAVAATILGIVGVESAASATSTTSLLVPQATAFSILGHSCGGIQEQAFATGFDATSGYPTGDVYLQTRCGGSGRGGGYHTTTYSAWLGVTWDFTGAVVSSVVLSVAPTKDPTFSAFDAYGNEVDNVSNSAFLTLAPTFVPTPRVTSVSLTSGPTAGGASLTITGTGFTGATAVSFGANAAAGFTVGSDTSITAVSPAASPGTVDLTVTTGGGSSAPSASDQFTFVAAPSVSSLSPNSGSVDGGTTVTITGTDFTGATAVSFGGTAVGFTINDDTSITVVSPVAESADMVHVTVMTPGGTSLTSAADQFSYNTPGPTASVSPTAGPTGTAVTVSGSGYSPGEKVKVRYMTGLVAPHPASVALCTANAAADGSFACDGIVPVKATAGTTGDHAIVARGTTSLAKATTVFTRT